MQTEAEVLTDIPRAEHKQKREAVKLNGVNSHTRRQQQRKEKWTYEIARTDTHMFDRGEVQHPDSQNQYRNVGYEQYSQVAPLLFLVDGGVALWLCFSLKTSMANKKNCTISWGILLA